ncbi:alkaline phosphatase family protein [Neobacillus piezotolerans]|uniref:Alkaline phosphatase family protein n=1 Tax=Neobacillus piezotolerans TaxID=2259171 RepID=A0A3D8GMW0_9BACI|nr:ectonucleotide pyrophosphatase/phosphodiesterase [Neobacillus piezotolerans]RDU35748.1 alkaline phosphatase family protein [Neobacillus piezotolerans]
MTRLTDHLIILSFDCLSSLDIPALLKLPNFQTFMNGSSYCTNVETIYPSVTYPCHTSIITGNYPNRHRVVNNTFIQPGRQSPDWYWHRQAINGTTLYDEAKKAGMETASLLWPVTARAKIDYNMPEIFANRPWQTQVMVSLFNGSPLFQIEMEARFGKIRKGIRQPELDDFVLESAVHTIKAKKPGLMLVHFVDLDSQRHHHGFSSNEANAALKRHDKRLGRILGAIRDSGLADSSTIAILGDHSALDVSKALKMNVLLKENGLIKTDKKGKINSWKAFCKSCDGSAYLYLKNPKDHETKKTLERLIDMLITDKRNGIETAYTGMEADRFGADGSAIFMLEALRGFYFEDSHEGTFIEDITEEAVAKRNFSFACHGYSPLKEKYSTVFFAKGKGILEGVRIPSMRLVDEGPTFARLLGISLGNTDGQVIEDIVDYSPNNMIQMRSSINS